jgi:hypothetical protein
MTEWDQIWSSLRCHDASDPRNTQDISLPHLVVSDEPNRCGVRESDGACSFGDA